MNLNLSFSPALIRLVTLAKSPLKIVELRMKSLYVFVLLLHLSPTADSQHQLEGTRAIGDVPEHHRAGDKSSILQRHRPCDNGIEVLAGTTQYGFAVQPGYVRCLSKSIYAKVSPFYSKEVDRGLYHYVTGFDVTAAYIILNAEHKFFLSGVVGLGFSQEKGRWRRLDTYGYHHKKGSSIFGVEGEYYFNNQFSAVVNANQHLVTDFEKTWGFHRWYVMAGLRYHFYRLHKCNPAATCPPKASKRLQQQQQPSHKKK